MQSVILGTAQWGLDYGATNAAGRLTDATILAIAGEALQLGITRLDTAPGYGDAQGRIRALAPSFGVQTKVSASGRSPAHVRHSVEASLSALGAAAVDAVLVHDWAALKPESQMQVATELEKLRDEGLTTSVGISGYEEADAASALAAFRSLDLVQVPVSILDQRLMGSPSLAAVRQRGGRIQARSVLLQGVAVAGPDQVPFGRHPDVVHLRHVGNPLNLCLGYIRALPWIDEAIIAVTSPLELDQAMAAWETPVARNEWASLRSNDEWLLDPRRWTEPTRAE